MHVLVIQFAIKLGLQLSWEMVQHNNRDEAKLIFSFFFILEAPDQSYEYLIVTSDIEHHLLT